MRVRAVAVMAVALFGAACTSDGDDATPVRTSSQGAASSAAESTAAPPLVDAEAVATVELLEPPESGAGEVPTFRWTAVPDAATYRLFVLDADGTPIWAWEGTATEVNLGGLDGDRPEGEAGPVISPGSSWTVAALDPDGHVIAVSPRRTVSP